MFRWYGLYTQRRPGIPGGRTAVLEPEDLEDEYFMLRIRIDGGALTSRQLRVIGENMQMLGSRGGGAPGGAPDSGEEERPARATTPPPRAGASAPAEPDDDEIPF